MEQNFDEEAIGETGKTVSSKLTILNHDLNFFYFFLSAWTLV